jgi:hypothetical protein
VELPVRLTAAADLSDGSLPVAGLAVVGVCALVFLALGLANYAGYGTFIVDAHILSPYAILALAWLGGGTLLVLVGGWLLGLGAAGWGVLGLVVAVAGVLAWVVGIVGLFWLPARLRPRWMRDRMEHRTDRPDGRGEAWR